VHSLSHVKVPEHAYRHCGVASFNIRKALECKQCRFTGEGVLFLPCTIPLVLARVALFGCPGGEAFGPVASRMGTVTLGACW